MTTTFETKVQCAVCGKESDHFGIGSTNTMGYPDLDTRSAEMARSTMFAWVQRCPECGYCYSDISMSVGGENQVVASPAYQSALPGYQSAPWDYDRDGLAALFICKGLIDEHTEQLAESAWAAIHAAWAFDDASNTESARSARDRAISLISMGAEAGQDFTDDADTGCAIVVDLLRRAGHLQEAETHLDQHSCSSEETVVLQILEYQRLLIRDGNTECHTIEEAIAQE